MNHTTPLAKQPSPEEYAGTYTHAPRAAISVRHDGGKLKLGNTPILFSAPDRGYHLDVASPGLPVEFIRDSNGKISRIRVNGRVAQKEPQAHR